MMNNLVLMNRITCYISTIAFSTCIYASAPSISVEIPKAPVAPQSFQVTHIPSSSYLSWGKEERGEVFKAVQKGVKVWENMGIADQYLVYGKQNLKEDSFCWEVVPMKDTSSWFSRFSQQFRVARKVIFGGRELSEEEKKKYDSFFKEVSLLSLQREKENHPIRGDDPFCNEEVIESQLIFEGELTYVLYNYNPIGFGKEKLHLLILPKAHREKFEDLKEEEYLEATELAQRVILKLSENRPIETIYLYHKVGKDAGQTVPHWHMHLVFVSSSISDFFTKLMFFKEMMIRSSPLSKEDLQEKVKALYSECNEESKSVS